MVHTIISTVGTSLIANLQNVEGVLGEGVRRGDWARMGAELTRHPPEDRVWGAEINSLHEMLSQPSFTAVRRLDFCVSDTEQGRNLGTLLTAYYRNFEVRVHRIADLRDDNPDRFRVHGLRNLARTLGSLVRAAGDASFVALNCTGGYKAQIAIGLLVGQALGLDVYYKHERFSKVIAFPPMPISFDYSLLARNAALLKSLEDEDQPLEQVEPALRTLLEEVKVDGRTLWALAPIGQIYLEAYRRHFPPEKNLPPDALEKKPPHIAKHHYPSGFEEYVERVWSQAPYVVTCRSDSYAGQAAIERRGFSLRHDAIVGHFRDSDFGARFIVLTTAETEPQRWAAVDDLNRRFC